MELSCWVEDESRSIDRLGEVVSSKMSPKVEAVAIRSLLATAAIEAMNLSVPSEVESASESTYTSLLLCPGLKLNSLENGRKSTPEVAV